MSQVLFVRAMHTLTLFDKSGRRVGSWEAYNNVDSHSRGIWPMGRYSFSLCLGWASPPRGRPTLGFG